MPIVKSNRFVFDDKEYEFNLDFKDDAIVKDSLEVGVIGKVRPHGSSSAEWASVELLVAVDLERNYIILSHKDIVIGKIPLSSEISDDWDDPDSDASLLNNEFECNENYADGLTLEEAIELIPALDPIIGCILKAGLSVAVGQIIRCTRKTQDIEIIKTKLRKIFGCLLTSSISMLIVGTGRALRCAASLGFV